MINDKCRVLSFQKMIINDKCRVLSFRKKVINDKCTVLSFQKTMTNDSRCTKSWYDAQFQLLQHHLSQTLLPPYSFTPWSLPLAIFKKAWEEMGICSLLQDLQLSFKSFSDGHAPTHKEENERIEPKMNWRKFIAQWNVFSSQYSKFSDSVSKNIQDLKLLKANRKVSWQQKIISLKTFLKICLSNSVKAKFKLYLTGKKVAHNYNLQAFFFLLVKAGIWILNTPQNFKKGGLLSKYSELWTKNL